MTKEDKKPYKWRKSGVLFRSAEEMWFWFVSAQEGRRDYTLKPVERPCKPEEILRVIGELRGKQVLQRDHLHILAYYGKERRIPRPYHPREILAARLWGEALSALDGAGKARGLIQTGGTS